MDDEPDWFGGAEEEPAPAPAPLKGKKKKSDKKDDAGKKEEEAPPAATPEAAPAEGAPAEEAAEAADEYLDPDKLLLFKHWIRPKFLPYKYLTDYRHNYYDDVIDFLDKRNKGISRDIPVAQTWAERALRTYTKNSNRDEISRIIRQDKQLVEETKFSGKFQLHHGKTYINRKFYSLIY
ncbi:flightin isoform X2 [Anthonomus grandis grandis]|uniref:flightin isoform X2 n=1 Tax=Anthonomus grandis grandis TaxID=2921223 RepID=UPI0021666EFA|nr:flightin isoform X2 [Anthonomus grandis grandis]